MSLYSCTISHVSYRQKPSGPFSIPRDAQDKHVNLANSTAHDENTPRRTQYPSPSNSPCICHCLPFRLPAFPLAPPSSRYSRSRSYLLHTGLYRSQNHGQIDILRLLHRLPTHAFVSQLVSEAAAHADSTSSAGILRLVGAGVGCEPKVLEEERENERG